MDIVRILLKSKLISPLLEEGTGWGEFVEALLQVCGIDEFDSILKSDGATNMTVAGLERNGMLQYATGAAQYKVNIDAYGARLVTENCLISLDGETFSDRAVIETLDNEGYYSFFLKGIVDKESAKISVFYQDSISSDLLERKLLEKSGSYLEYPFVDPISPFLLKTKLMQASLEKGGIQLWYNYNGVVGATSVKVKDAVRIKGVGGVYNCITNLDSLKQGDHLGTNVVLGYDKGLIEFYKVEQQVFVSTNDMDVQHPLNYVVANDGDEQNGGKAISPNLHAGIFGVFDIITMDLPLSYAAGEPTSLELRVEVGQSVDFAKSLVPKFCPVGLVCKVNKAIEDKLTVVKVSDYED